MCRKLIYLIPFVFVMVFAFVGAAQAVNVLTNGGFEDRDPGDFDGWTRQGIDYGITGVWFWGDGTAAINTTDAYEGLASADFYTAGGWSGGAGVFQEILIGGGVPVSISAYVKGAGGNGASIDMVFFDFNHFEEVQIPSNIGKVALSIGGGVLIPGGGVLYTGPISGSLGAADALGWQYGVLNAVTPAGTMCMKFEVNNNGGTGDLLFDNVVGTPEPATIALLGLGGLALIRRKR